MRDRRRLRGACRASNNFIDKMPFADKHQKTQAEE